jgi:hypothetical protein
MPVGLINIKSICISKKCGNHEHLLHIINVDKTENEGREMEKKKDNLIFLNKCDCYN